MDETLGMIKMFAGNFAPQNFAFCQGQEMNLQQYMALYSLLGVTFGGDGSTKFNLPDLRGRVPVGTGAGGPVLGTQQITQGQVGGALTVAINANNLPIHTHGAAFSPIGGGGPVTVKVSANAGAAKVPTNTPPNAVLAAPVDNSAGADVQLYNNDPNPSVTLGGVSGGGIMGGAVTIQPGGGSPSPAPVSVMQPFLGMNFVIAINGLYPDRP